MKFAILLALLLAGCEPQTEARHDFSPRMRCETKMVMGMAEINCPVKR